MQHVLYVLYSRPPLVHRPVLTLNDLILSRTGGNSVQTFSDNIRVISFDHYLDIYLPSFPEKCLGVLLENASMTFLDNALGIYPTDFLEICPKVPFF